MADGIITTDQRGAGDDKTYGADVAPTPPVQDMWEFDLIAGAQHDRTDAAAEFTGGDSGVGLGGMAEPMEAGGDRYERRGF